MDTQTAPDSHALARQISVLEERMNTHQATYEKALEGFERRMAERDTRLEGFERRMAERDTRLEGFERRMAERETARAERETAMADRIASSRWWQTAILSGVIIGGAGIVTAIILAAL